MANQNPTRKTKPKARVTEPPGDRAQRIEVLAAMVITASVIVRKAETVLAQAALAAADEMTPEEQATLLRCVAQETRPYSEAMIRRLITNPDVFGRLAPIVGGS